MAILALVSACGPSAPPDRAEGGGSSGGPRVVTTVAPLTSIVASIAGDRVAVVGLVPEGTNSHTFEPPPSAAATIAAADLVFLNGLGLEEPTKELAEVSQREDAHTISLGERVLAEDEYIYDFSFPRDGGRPNPHTWTDPSLAIEYAAVVAQVLSDLDPSGAGTFRRNLSNFKDRAGALHAAMRTASATVGARKLLTYHDAYAYFARTYDWEVIGAIQVSDFREPTPREVGELVRQVRQQKVPAIFGSEVFPSAVLEQIGRETGVRYVDVLRDDDLPGEPGDPAHSWLGLMRFNFITMVGSLGGDASALQSVSLVPPLPDSAEYSQ